jgi:beta-glucan synthesis-associated protein KRE6
MRSMLGSVNSASSCPRSDHPCPAVTQGRGSPEIDIFEAKRDKANPTGQVASQSAQFAPFSHDYTYLNNTLDELNIFDPTMTWPNTYHGSAVYVTFLLLPCFRGCVEQDFPCFRQQAILSLAKLPPDMFQGSPNKRLVTTGTSDLFF